MNKIYRIIWSESLASFVAVTENASSRGKRSGTVRKVSLGGVAALSLSSLICPFALAAPPLSFWQGVPAAIAVPSLSSPAVTAAPSPSTSALPTVTPNTLPTNGQVSTGQASISQSGAAMTIDQTSNRATVNWDSFNLGSNASIQFKQPGANSATLNRVQGTDPSQIFGKISAPGQVFILNPNGILFGATSQVNVGGIVATTHRLSDADFMAGKLFFERAGSNGAVINQGNITTALAGYAALLAPEVRQEGIIIARMGTVALASGDAIALQMEGSSLVNLAVTPSTIQSLISNGNAIQAPGGLIILSAKSASTLASGTIQNNGQLDASSLTEKGGRILLEGDSINLGTNARINASGAKGGGIVLVGGDQHGGNPQIFNAQNTSVALGAEIKVDAAERGDGGKAIVWANNTTNYNGSISAKGGIQGGNGGFVEVSGKNTLNFNGTVNTTAEKGVTGTLLLDPTDIFIGSAGSDNAGSHTPGPNITGLTGSSVLGVDVLTTALAANNVVVDTASAQTAPLGGTITVANNISWSSTNSLTLKANNDILLTGGGINATGIGAGVSLIANQSGTGVTGEVKNTGGSLYTNGGNIVLSGKKITSNAVSLQIDSCNGCAVGTNAGNVTITATDSVSLAGPVYANAKPTSPAAGSVSGGNGGVISVTAMNGIALGYSLAGANNFTYVQASGGAGGTTTNTNGGNAGSISIRNGYDIGGNPVAGGTGQVNVGGITVQTGAANGTGTGGVAGTVVVKNNTDVGNTVPLPSNGNITVDSISTTGVANGNGGGCDLDLDFRFRQDNYLKHHFKFWRCSSIGKCGWWKCGQDYDRRGNGRCQCRGNNGKRRCSWCRKRVRRQFCKSQDHRHRCCQDRGYLVASGFVNWIGFQSINREQNHAFGGLCVDVRPDHNRRIKRRWWGR